MGPLRQSLEKLENNSGVFLSKNKLCLQISLSSSDESATAWSEQGEWTGDKECFHFLLDFILFCFVLFYFAAAISRPAVPVDVDSGPFHPVSSTIVS